MNQKKYGMDIHGVTMKIIMNAPEYFNEHKRLIKLLLSAHTKKFIVEAKKQIAEVKKQKQKLKKQALARRKAHNR